MLKEVQLILAKLSCLSTLEKVLMTNKLENSSSPKHRSLNRRSSSARDHDAMDCGTETKSKAEAVVSRRSMVRNRRRSGRQTYSVIHVVHVGDLAILGHFSKINLKIVQTN